MQQQQPLDEWEEEMEQYMQSQGWVKPEGNEAIVITPHTKCAHAATTPVKVAGHDIWLGSSLHIPSEVAKSVDLLLPLNGDLPRCLSFGEVIPGKIVIAELVDYGGVPKCWEQFIHEVAKVIEKEKKVLAWCTGSHGRTGCFYASLIAVMEPDVEDPIAEARERHCFKAVESVEQGEAVFALKGQELPMKYQKSLSGKKSFVSYAASGGTYDSAFANVPLRWRSLSEKARSLVLKALNLPKKWAKDPKDINDPKVINDKAYNRICDYLEKVTDKELEGPETKDTSAVSQTNSAIPMYVQWRSMGIGERLKILQALKLPLHWVNQDEVLRDPKIVSNSDYTAIHNYVKAQATSATV